MICMQLVRSLDKYRVVLHWIGLICNAIELNVSIDGFASVQKPL